MLESIDTEQYLRGLNPQQYEGEFASSTVAPGCLLGLSLAATVLTDSSLTLSRPVLSRRP